MRLLGAVIATAALLVSGLPAAGAAAPNPCRHQWVGLHQLHGENGNPDGSGATSQLQWRWDSYYDEAGRQAHEATRDDCDGIKAFAQAWDGLERLMYGMHRHDYLFQLRIANSELRHYRDFTGRNPGRAIMRAFKFLRLQAPKANGDLASIFAAAPAVITMEPTQVSGYLRDFRTAARASNHAMKAKVWLRIIEDAELDEE
jgi:hypothetical protein